MFKSFGRFIIVLLDLSVTIALYICVLFMNNPIRGNIHMLHCHVLCYIYIYIVFFSLFIIVHCGFHYIIQQFSLIYVVFYSKTTYINENCCIIYIYIYMHVINVYVINFNVYQCI